MPDVAFYRVLTDKTVLSFPQEEDATHEHNTHTLDFTVTGDIVLSESYARPMLCFQMDPSDNSKIELEVFIRNHGDKRICRYNLIGGTMRYTMEPFDPKWLDVDDNNRLIFKADVKAGSLKIRNVVVFFQRNI